jgi:CO/xanthine dehydrogenase FAD-binding subunit
MKPASFKYVAVHNEEALLDALDEYGGEARLLAGGQSLVPMMNFRVVSPAVIIDINPVQSLSFIKDGDDSIEIGALTRHAMLEDSEAVRTVLPIAGEAIAYLAHRAVRNRGTMGGSLALAYPNAELPLLFVALDADVLLRSKAGDRRVPVADFIAGPLQTVLAEDEFIHSARLPLPPRSAGTAFIEVARRHGDFALASAAAIVLIDDDGRLQSVQVAVSGGQGFPIRVTDAEAALVGQRATAALFEDSARMAVEALEIEGEGQIPAGYRRLLLTTMLQRALETAAARSEHRRVH